MKKDQEVLYIWDEFDQEPVYCGPKISDPKEDFTIVEDND